jgi:hypothetical protein
VLSSPGSAAITSIQPMEFVPASPISGRQAAKAGGLTPRGSAQIVNGTPRGATGVATALGQAVYREGDAVRSTLVMTPRTALAGTGRAATPRGTPRAGATARRLADDSGYGGTSGDDDDALVLICADCGEEVLRDGAAVACPITGKAHY